MSQEGAILGVSITLAALPGEAEGGVQPSNMGVHIWKGLPDGVEGTQGLLLVILSQFDAQDRVPLKP